MAASSSSSSRKGHTAAQLEFTWEIPPATPATSDFVCWLWAAFPQREGMLNISRVASALDVSRTTVRRWIANDDPRLTRQQLNMLIRRSILRGRGHHLWPPLDAATRRRSELNLEYALRCDKLIRTDPASVPPEWEKTGALRPRDVHLIYFPRAHVYGVSALSHEKAEAKVRRYGEIIETTRAANKYAGIALKHLTLERVDASRCIAPRALVPTGRTETWLESAGRPKLRKRLPQ